MILKPVANLEALLFAFGKPMHKTRVAKLLEIQETELPSIIKGLAENLSERGITLIETEHELELRTAPEAVEIVSKLRENELSRDIGKAGLEVLSIILYRGGATRGEIDWLRGVNSSATVRSLALRGLIKGAEDSADKRRVRYSATIDALAHLGVSKAEDLPQYAEFSKALKDVEYEMSSAT